MFVVISDHLEQSLLQLQKRQVSGVQMHVVVSCGSVLDLSCSYQCTGVCGDEHPGTSQITSSQPLMLLLTVVVCVLQT